MSNTASKSEWRMAKSVFNSEWRMAKSVFNQRIEFKYKIKQMKAYQYEYPRPSVTVDIVLYSYFENDLKILLIERRNEPFAGSWALPGGFVDKNENVLQAAERELLEETNLSVLNLKQFYVASDQGRDPRGWTISVVFIGFINNLRIEAKAGDDAKNLKWFPVNNYPSLAFDHDKIIEESKLYLKQTSNHSVFDKELLPGQFQLSNITNILLDIGHTPDHAEKLINRLIEYKVIQKIDKEYYRFDEAHYAKVQENGYIEIPEDK